MCPGYRETAETNSEKRRGIWPAMLTYGRFTTTWGLGAGHESIQGAPGAQAARRAPGQRGAGRGRARRGGRLLVVGPGASLPAQPHEGPGLPARCTVLHRTWHRTVVGAFAGIGLVQHQHRAVGPELARPAVSRYRHVR